MKNMAGQQAFEGSRSSIYNVDPDSEQIRIVGLDVPATDELAHLYDERCHDPVDESMAKNMMIYGVTEPIIVTKVAKIGCVIDGRQRLKAARRANELLLAEGKAPLRIPVMMRRGANHDLFGVMVSSNELRHDDNPMNRAEKVERFLNMGRSVSEAAATFGVSEVAIGQWRKLLTLDARVQKMVRDDKISAHAASTLAKLPPDEQFAKATEAIEQGAKSGGKRPTARTITKSTSDKPIPPKKRMINKIFELPLYERPKVRARHNDFWDGVRFMRGELSPEDVGIDLEAIEAKLEEFKEKKKAKKKAEKKAEKKNSPKVAKKKTTKKKNAESTTESTPEVPKKDTAAA